MDAFLLQLRYSLRSLAKSPGFVSVAVLTLGLGIGASTTVFSVLHAILLSPLPYPNAEEIVRVWEEASDGHGMTLSDPNFRDFHDQNRTFSTLAKYNYGPQSVDGGSEPVRIMAASVSREFFDVLGTEPFFGHVVTPLGRSNGEAVIVSYTYWRAYLGESTDLSKFHLAVNGRVYDVSGVMPRGFDFPNGAGLWIVSEIPEVRSRTAHNWNCIGRINKGSTVAQARADLNAIARRIRDEKGEEVDLTGVLVIPLADALSGAVRPALLALFGAASLLFLVAAANVAGLLLARTLARQKEAAVCSALGAGRTHLMLPHLIDSFAIASGGGALGILGAGLGMQVLSAIAPTDLPRHQVIGLNGPVLFFALAATMLVGLPLGVFVGWRGAGGDLQKTLSVVSRTQAGMSDTYRMRFVLTVAEIAATFVILVAAGLLGRSFWKLVSINPGFREENLLTVEFSPPNPQDTSISEVAVVRQIHLFDDILSRLSAIPGVESAGVVGAYPVARGDDLADGDFLLLNGQAAPSSFDDWSSFAQNPSRVGHAYYCVVGQGYFGAMGIPLIRGRLFGDQDGRNSLHVALISETLARDRWPGQDPVGEVIDFGNMDGDLKPMAVIGIVGDVRARGLDYPPIPVIYVDYRQRGINPNSSPTFVLRIKGSSGNIVAGARGVFHDLAPQVPVKFSTYVEEIGSWLADRRFLLLLVVLFGTAALLLAAVGISGVVAFSVIRRTKEIGIRVALGAQRRDILRLILAEAARMAVFGVVIGTFLSLAITRVITSLLFETVATDPLTFMGIAIVLALATILASMIPAARALRLDPNRILRYE
jgi:putative ABC transport system permease protein